MDDLDRRRAVAQDRERVQQALDAVVALDERLEVVPGLDAVALVVDDQARAVALVRQQVDHARDERPARRGGVEREGERVLAARAHRRRASRAAGAAASAPAIRRAICSRSSALVRMPSSRARAATSWGEGARGERKSSVSSSACTSVPRARASSAPAVEAARARARTSLMPSSRSR